MKPYLTSIMAVLLFILFLLQFLDLRQDHSWRYNASLAGLILSGLIMLTGFFTLFKKTGK